jgi:putative aminopeptidase FrvX
VLVAVDNPDAGLTGLASELELLAVREGITVAKDYSASIPRVSYTQGPRFPERLAHLSVATAWPVTPAEFLDRGDLAHLANLLSKWIGAPGEPRPSVAEMRPTPPIERPRTAPPVNDILKKLVEAYGVSGAEERVRQVVQDLLPPWASPVTDDAGNLILRIPAGGAGGKNANRIAFVAHMDEIGYEVRSISDDGRLVVRTRGGGNPEFFQGHSMLVHRKEGELLMGVLELPAGWDEANFEWPRGAQAGGVRLDIGARSVAEVSERNVRAGDTVTIPKKYRPLLGHRANGRSFDDRVGCAALISAAWALGKNAQGGQAMPKSLPAEIILIWATREELGLEGALADAAASAQKGETPDYVFAVDTFVSSDSPIELQRFADAPIGKGFVIRAVDNSNITDRKYVDKLIALARAHQIPVQYGITGGGNDGAAYLRHGAVDIPISWPLRYSHSPGEVIDTRDVDALARIVAAIARSW